MPAFDAHIHAFQDDRTERASLDRINQAKEHWQAYIQGSTELELTRKLSYGQIPATRTGSMEIKTGLRAKGIRHRMIAHQCRDSEIG